MPALVLAQEKWLDVGIAPSLPQGRRTVQQRDANTVVFESDDFYEILRFMHFCL